MHKCYFCGCEINNDNESLEHIIPNGIAGCLTSKKILCEEHNNKLSKLDYELCEDLVFFTNFLNPKRDRGENPKAYYTNDDGLKIAREADGKIYAKPQVQINELENGNKQIKFRAYYSPTDENKDKAIQLLKSIFIGNAKKIGLTEEKIEAKLNEIDANISTSTEIIEKPIMHFKAQFNKNGKLFLALCKIALNYYFENELPSDYIKAVLDAFIDGNLTVINKISNYYYPENFYLSDSIYHSIILKGDTNQKCLYCLISMYSTLNVIILLNDNYTGENIYKSYVYDLRNEKEICFNTDINIKSEEFKELLSTSIDFGATMSKAWGRFMNFFVAYDRKPEDLINNVEKIFNEIQNGKYIDNEEDYKNTLNCKIFEFCNSKKEYKILQEKYKEDLFNITYSFFPYEKYLYPIFCNTVSSYLSKQITNLLLNKSELIDNSDELEKYLISSIDNIQTDNPVINSMINNDRENVELASQKMIKTFYSQLKVYQKLLRS